jgi:inosine-uridine nucleoside N-ribohydrolase
LHNIGKPDIPVVMGSSHPLGMEASFAAHMHGSNGLGGVEIPHSERKAISTDRFGAIYKIIMECPGKVAFVNTGSLTNLALLLTSYPELKEKIS